MARSYDYVIVGAGSAGCTLANRLSEDAGARILVIEAGGWDRDPWIHIPLGWGRILENRLHDWGYFAEPEPRLDNRAIECARGKVVGGSSSINAMAYVRGHRGDYDRWAASGLTGWSYQNVLPYFKRSECWEEGADDYRGATGPLHVKRATYDDPLVRAWIACGKAAGHGSTEDYNGAQQAGFATIQSTIRKGRRWSAASAYLRPAIGRRNLELAIKTLVTRIVFEGDRAVGVEIERAGQRETVFADREVLLAGGTINSPQVLMLSGIGDPVQLQRHGITVRAALPGVGQNLQDHISVGVEYLRKGRGPFVAKMRVDRLAVELGRAYFAGTGFATDLPSGFMAFLHSGLSGALPDIQLLHRAVPMSAGPWLPPFKLPYQDGFALRAVLLRPESRGRVELASADPKVMVRIHQNMLATERDWRVLRAGVRMTQAIGHGKDLAPFVEREIGPGPATASDPDLDGWIRKSAATAHHPLGTCKMGLASDALSVVDPELRVHGVRNLRVIDASVMPDLVGGNINAPVIMIAERASDLIRGKLGASGGDSAVAH